MKKDLGKGCRAYKPISGFIYRSNMNKSCFEKFTEDLIIKNDKTFVNELSTLIRGGSVISAIVKSKSDERFSIKCSGDGTNILHDETEAIRSGKEWITGNGSKPH